MCGIIGYVGKQAAVPIIIDGLKRLEYRGYDSAGVAVIQNGKIEVRRSVGKIRALETLIQNEKLDGQVGIGHTRWATHGRPSENNAHPHLSSSGRFVVVHNGIIENYLELRERLAKKGYVFKSETDTEVVAHLIEDAFRDDFTAAVKDVLRLVKGSYALGIMSVEAPRKIIGARKDAPLAVGIGNGEMFLASDVSPLLPYTREVIFMEEGEVAEISDSALTLWSASGEKIERKPTKILWDSLMAEKAGFKHFMLKEIHDQPRSVQDTFRGRLKLEEADVDLTEAGLTQGRLAGIRQVQFVACGTSYHAALVARYWIEHFAKIPAAVDIASEYRYRDLLIQPNTLLVAITQSGETADTLAALREAKKRGAQTLAVCNVVGSTVTRDAEGVLDTHCGPEIGVASTKAFTGQLSALILLAIGLGRAQNKLSADEARPILQDLLKLPHEIQSLLDHEKKIAALAKRYSKREHFLYLGRNISYPIALEGALKLKEISYIHAEGYPAGELKHGPIALIDENMPVVAIAPQSATYDKLLSNVEEVRARGGNVIALATEGNKQIGEKASDTLFIPAVREELSPFLTIIPLQILAYYVAVLRGCDVDQPRNLAKSVTVE